MVDEVGQTNDMAITERDAKLMQARQEFGEFLRAHDRSKVLREDGREDGKILGLGKEREVLSTANGNFGPDHQSTPFDRAMSLLQEIGGTPADLMPGKTDEDVKARAANKFIQMGRSKEIPPQIVEGLSINSSTGRYDVPGQLTEPVQSNVSASSANTEVKRTQWLVEPPQLPEDRFPLLGAR